MPPLSSQQQDEHWMQRALTLAQQAAEQGEVPVGAIVVLDNEVIGQGYNQSIESSDCTAHAEIVALRDAGQALQTYRFPDATLYCTLEPCPMCAGAMLHARIARLVYAADDPKAGAAGSVVELLDEPRMTHRVIVSSGVLAQPSSDLLSEFFRARR